MGNTLSYFTLNINDLEYHANLTRELTLAFLAEREYISKEDLKILLEGTMVVCKTPSMLGKILQKVFGMADENDKGTVTYKIAILDDAVVGRNTFKEKEKEDAEK